MGPDPRGRGASSHDCGDVRGRGAAECGRERLGDDVRPVDTPSLRAGRDRPQRFPRVPLAHDHAVRIGLSLQQRLAERDVFRLTLGIGIHLGVTFAHRNRLGVCNTIGLREPGCGPEPEYHDGTAHWSVPEVGRSASPERHVNGERLRICESLPEYVNVPARIRVGLTDTLTEWKPVTERFPVPIARTVPIVECVANAYVVGIPESVR